MDDGDIRANTEFKGFFLDDRVLNRFSADQIIDIGGIGGIGGEVKVDTGI